MLIDTHTHLYLEDFKDDIGIVIQNALQNDIQKMLLPNIDMDSVEPMLNLHQQFKDCTYIMTGLHPTSVDKAWRTTLNNILTTIEKQAKPIAVGEAGIDLYWDKTFVEEQKEAFIFQIEYAINNNLPIVIHSRNSLDLIIEMIKPYQGKLRGVFHCFPGHVQQAIQLVDQGFYLGLGGVVTYKNAKMAEVAAQLPLESIILETDAPFLSPQGKRGQRNESANIKDIALFIAEKRNTDFETICKVTTANAYKLFDL
ncbi:MAG: hydrolase TatD [Bacteroidetes bacterium HGW-Bacteroidetes-21]|jgi:TatD DNase family protein|nr:MAG: hydrolase TatD [Bacteroidetes bacterium HGW-Bacteroidetes-21]